MKKFIFMMIAMVAFAIGANAQDKQQNYAGSSKFTDNVSVTVQAGTLTTLNDFYAGHTALAPIVLVGVDKYINPWLGFGLEGRTLIGTGNGRFNEHTAFDAVNVSFNTKVNLLNAIKYDGTRKFFEPVPYVGIGWGHATCSNAFDPNWVTFRAGSEFNFNVGKDKAWAVVVNPSVVWGDISNFRLEKSHGNFEVTIGAVYHFPTSNGKRSIAKAKLYDENEVAQLKKRISELESRKPRVKTVEKIVEKVVEKEVPVFGPGGTRKYMVMFELGKAELSDDAKAELDKVDKNAVVNIDAYASPEGNEKYNLGLSEQRKNVVKEYLENRGVKVNEARFHGAADKYSNRVAIVTYN